MKIHKVRPATSAILNKNSGLSEKNYQIYHRKIFKTKFFIINRNNKNHKFSKIKILPKNQTKITPIILKFNL